MNSPPIYDPTFSVGSLEWRDYGVMGWWGCGIMWFWMYDTQVQGSEVTILLTLHSRFSAVFIGFPGVESLWH